MAFWNKKKKDEEESTKPSSSADSAPSSRVANALRNILNATAEGQRKAAQADQAVAQAGQKKLADAAQNLYAAAVRGQQAATRADQAVAGAQTRRVQEAAQGIYSAVQQQQERAARDQMAAQQRRMQAPTRRAQDAAAGLYSAVLLQQQSGMPMIQAPTPRAADAARALRSITAPRRQNSEPAERDDGILANLFRQQERQFEIQQDLNDQRVFKPERLKAAGEAALAGTAAGYTGTGRALYEAGQTARDAQNRELLDQYSRDLERARRDYEAYLQAAGGNVNDRDVVSQGYIVEDLQRKYDAMSKVVNEQVQQKATEAATQLTQQLEQQAQAATERAKDGTNAVGGFAVDAAINMMEMAMDDVAGIATGGENLIPMALRVFGQAASKAQQKGAGIGKQLGYGSAVAGIEVFTEKMFDGLAGLYGKGAADEITESLIRRLAKSNAGRSALRLVFGMNEEGIEELVSDALSPAAELILDYDSGKSFGQNIAGSYRNNFDITETLYNYLIGAAVAGGMNAARPVTAIRSNAEENAALARVDAAEQAYKNAGAAPKEARALAEITAKVLNGDTLTEREQKTYDASELAGRVTESMRGETGAAEIFESERAGEQSGQETTGESPQEQSWRDRVAAAMARMEAEQGDVDYDQDAAFIGTDGNPVLWNTTDQRHAALLNGRGGLNAAINDGYIRIKRGEGIELAVDNGVLSPQQAQAIRKLVDGFTGNTFRVDMDVMAGDDTQTIGALEFEGADIDGRRIVDAINREIRRNAQQTNENAPPAAKAGAESTSVNTDPSMHTQAEQRIVEDYRASTDTDLVDFVQEVLAAPGDEANGDTFGLNPVSGRAIQDIKRITGVDATGYRTAIQGSMVKHIYHDHGPNGVSDQSMSDINDIGRIQYVLDNYDSAEKGKGTKAYRTNKPNGGQGPAQTVVFRKAVNGTYYVVEAVPDTRAKTAYVVTAYMEKNRTGTEYAPDAYAPSRTAETEGTQSPVYGNSINHSRENGNSENSVRESNEGYGNPGRVERAAAEHFGTTDDFRTAGYMLTDGTMLDFSGAHWLEGYDDDYIADWRRKNDIRQVDHEDIFEAYEALGDEFPNDSALDFMRRGNIRMVPEGPGLEIATAKEPSAAQYRRIKEYVREMADGGGFTIDFTRDRRSRAGTLRYNGNVSADRVVNDIKHFFRTGEVRQPSTVLQFRETEEDLKERHPEYANDEENLQLAAEAVDDLQYSLFDEDYISGWSGERGTVQSAEEAGQQVRTLGKGITAELVQNGYVEFRGKTVNSPEELAQLAQCLRDPRFETFRLILMKGNEIVSVRSISSKLPGYAIVTDKGMAREAWEIKDRMRRTGADGYYLMHNHPSGNVEASDNDLFTTGVFINALGSDGYRGHIILDHTEYGLIEDIPNYDPRTGSTRPTASVREIPGANGKDPLRKDWNGETAIGGQIMNADDIAFYGRMIQTSDDVTVILYRAANGEVNGVQEVLNKTFLNNSQFRGYMKNQLVEFGSTHAAIYTTNRSVFDMTGDLTREGYTIDAVYADPSLREDQYESIRADYGIAPEEDYFAGKKVSEYRRSVNEPQAYGDIRRQLADAEREYMEHSDANDAEYDYRAQLDKINDLRRQIEEAESINAEADNVNAETDTNPTIEAMEREGRVSRGTYDVEKYGDTHPERGEVGRDGVRMCNTTADLEAELNEIGGARIRNDTGEYFARIRRKNDNGYLLTINRDGKRDTSRSFSDYKEASAYAASYIEGQTQARTDAELDAEKSAPVRRQEPIEALTTGQVQDEAKRQKQNKAAEMSTQSLRDRIRKTDEEIKALRRLEKTTGLTETQAKHKADLQETLEILNDELTNRKGRAKAKKEKVEVKGNRPVRSAAEAKNRLMEIFHTAPGQRADTNTKLEAKLAEIVSSGKITEQNREDILDMLIDAGMVRQEAEQEYRDVRDWLRGSRIYVSEHDRADFGDDWEGIRKSAWANGIYLTSNESDRSVDSLVSELAETFGTNMFPTDDAPSDMVRNLIEQAEKGRSSMITFAEAVNNEARMEHVDPQEIWNDLARQTDETLRAFAEKAKLEMDLKDRTASMLATERKRAEDRMERMVQRRRESEIREKTMKAIKRLARLRGKAAPEVRTQIDEALKDIDTQARQLTINGLEDLQELARVYEDAKKAAGYESEENPGNFISNPYIEQRLARLTQKHINDMDIDDVIELGRVVSALENTVKTNGKMIGEQFDSEVKTVADKVNAEVQSSRGAKPGFLQKWFAEEQLSPRRFLELLGGWKKGAMAELADSLEKGQTKMLDFQRRAAQLMDPFMSKKENRKWLKTASGKNAKWYTYSVANGMAMDGSGITGQTIEITPMMKVSLYLASLNEDNLRHIQTGGLRIPDKALYIKGKTQEAFAQGQIVKMQPQAVRAIASSLTQEEKTFAGYLQKFFDNQSKNAINEVSMQLDGFERAGVDNYFPIESDRSFIKSDVSGEARAQTVEGIGSISNDRVHAGNPIRLDDAYNVFMRQVTNVSRYYGYAIPIRNFQAVNNYVFHEEGNAFAGSIKDTINRKWGAGAENYITKMLADIQGASSKGDMTSRFLSMLRGNLAGATLAVNPSVAVSQTASYPGAAQAVGWDGLAAGLVSGPVDEKLIEKYTPLLWYRSQGYSTQEIGDAVSAQNKSLAQKALASKALNWIQTMDRLAVKRIWKAAEYRVTKDTGLKPGSKALIDSGMDPYYQKVAEVFNRAVYDTQPNYTDMERAQILRSDSDLTKFLTMYKTVPLQYYGMTVEAVGRMQAALKSGDKTEIRKARKYAADTFGGLLAANSVYVIMKALFKSFRGKDKDYRDEEGEITPESYFKQLGKDLAETYAGSIIGGAEAYSLITGWINGDTFRAPEINVLSSVEDIANGFQSIFKAIDDDDPGKTAKAVKDAAENIAMVCGLPVKNVETYLMAAIRYIQPQTAMQYDSFFGGLSKGDLKGMDSDTIGSAASIIMNSRTGANMERAATDELSRLYTAGFTDAIPTAIPDSFEYAGNTVKIKDRGAYRETWGGTVGDNLEELTANESYINADDKTKEAMIRKLYQYATVQARMGADPAYTVEGNSTYGWTEKADAAMESGMDLPTVIAAMTTMNAMTADKVNGQTVKSKKTKVVEYIDSLKLDGEQKDALYELAGYESGLEKAPWHSGISAEAGYTTETNKPVINEAARKRAVEANYQQLTSSAAYKAADDQTKKAMIEKLNQYAEVQGMVTTDPDYLPTGTAGWTIWAETAEKAGIDLISAIDYATQLDSFKADYNEYGKAISGSKKDKVTKYIDALDLTNEQKDILYLKIYAENSLKYTPWHGYTGKKKTRRGGGRRGSGKKSTAAKKPVSVGKITPKYSTGIDISALFPTASTARKNGKGNKTLAADLAEIVNSGLDISELFRLPTTGTKAPKGRTKVDFEI